MTDLLHADLSRRVVIDTATMPWEPGTRPDVSRKRLELSRDADRGRLTSLARYAPGCALPAHGHPEGEEILVLEGGFSDEHGDYPAGTYILNPPGFAHAPSSQKGCVTLVKLGQYRGEGRKRFAVDTSLATFVAGEAPGTIYLPLYRDLVFPEVIGLYRLAPGAEVEPEVQPGGEEIFVLSGALEDDEGTYPAGTWLRSPPGSVTRKRSREGAVFYRKQGHLG